MSELPLPDFLRSLPASPLQQVLLVIVIVSGIVLVLVVHAILQFSIHKSSSSDAQSLILVSRQIPLEVSAQPASKELVIPMFASTNICLVSVYIAPLILVTSRQPRGTR